MSIVASKPSSTEKLSENEYKLIYEHSADSQTVLYARDDEGNIPHRLDGPAIKWHTSSKAWYYEGMLHRTDGPAVEHANGNTEWWIYNHRHRDNGPAIEYPETDRGEWWNKGVLHREGGPAIYGPNYRAWYKEGRKHRIDGPAVEKAPGCALYYVNDMLITEENFNSIYVECNDLNVHSQRADSYNLFD